MKFQLPPQTHFERLQVSAVYLSMQRGLKRAAWGSLGWGAFTLALGSFVRSRAIFDYIWLAIGMFLVLEGVWIMRSAAADPRLLLAEAAALTVLGLLNTVGLYLEIRSGIRPVGGLQVIFAGILQLLSAYTTYRSYPALKQICQYLDRACLYELETMIGDMWKRKSEAVPELADFKCENKRCKVKFFQDLAILLLQGGSQVVLVQKTETKIVKARNVLLSKSMKVELQLEDSSFKTEMNHSSLDKWLAWLGLGLTAIQTQS